MKEKFNPLSGRSDAMIQYYISNNLIPERNKIIIANFASIFNELEADQNRLSNTQVNNDSILITFYDLSFDKQSELFNKKVDQYVVLVEESKPKPVLSNPFTQN